MRQLGWEKNQNPAHPRLYTLEPTTLSKLAKSLKSKLNIRTMRVMSDPDLLIKNVISSWGIIVCYRGFRTYPYRRHHDWRNQRMGAGRIHVRCDNLRAEKGSDHFGASGIGAGGYEVLRRVAERFYQRSTHCVCGGR
jgi:hypothetical protein